MHCCISFSRDEFETTRCEAPRQCLHIPAITSANTTVLTRLCILNLKPIKLPSSFLIRNPGATRLFASENPTSTSL
ncbi:hypothetical protein V6Z12_D06G124000 [Gossypium hirsutum]